MALDTAPILTRQRTIAAKLETTTGTAISLAAANAAFLAYDPSLEEDAAAIDRPRFDTASKRVPTFGQTSGNYKFRTELYGAGASTPIDACLSPLFQCCGLSLSTATFTPVDNPVNTLTMALWEGAGSTATEKAIVGAMGTFKITGEAGKIAMVEWDFKGAWVAPTAGAPPSSISYPSLVPPRVVSCTLTINSQVFRISKFMFDAGNKVILRSDVTSATGIRAAYITDRNPRFSVDPEQVPLATEDWYALRAGMSTVALNLVIGSATDNTITIAAGNMALQDPAKTGNRDDMNITDLNFVPTSTSSAGQDEYSIVFS